MQALPFSPSNQTATELKPASAADNGIDQTAANSGGEPPQFAQMLGTVLADENGSMQHSDGERGSQGQLAQSAEPTELNELALPELAAQERLSGDRAWGSQLATPGQVTQISDTALANSATGQTGRTSETVQQAATNTASSGNPLPPGGQVLPLQSDVNTRQMKAQLSAATDIAKSANPVAKTELDLDSPRWSKDIASRIAEFNSDSEFSREAGEFSSRRAELPALEKVSSALQLLQSLAPQVKADADNSVLTGNTNSNSQALQPAATLIPKLDSGIDSQPVLDSARSAAGKPEPVLRDQLTAAFGSARFHGDFAGKLRVLSQANISTVELNLNPAELGAIDIRIQSLDDGTVINFYSSNANTREVIDASLPRLRELLSDSGIQLQHGDVSERNPDTDKSQSHEHRELTMALPEELAEMQPMFRSRQENRSMVDHYV